MIFIALLALFVFVPMAILSTEQKHDFKKHSYSGESYDQFCKRYYSHYI